MRHIAAMAWLVASFFVLSFAVETVLVTNGIFVPLVLIGWAVATFAGAELFAKVFPKAAEKNLRPLASILVRAGVAADVRRTSTSDLDLDLDWTELHSQLVAMTSKSPILFEDVDINIQRTLDEAIELENVSEVRGRRVPGGITGTKATPAFQLLAA